MKTKKVFAAVLAGTMLALAPLSGMGSYGTAFAAKGGARISAPAPKVAPAAPKTTPSAGAEHKSVSGNGGSYAPSKSAKDLEKNAPAAKSGTGMMGNTAQSGSRFGCRYRQLDRCRCGRLGICNWFRLLRSWACAVARPAGSGCGRLEYRFGGLRCG